MKTIFFFIMILSMSTYSQFALAKSATEQQIHQIIAFEHWNKIKTALQQQNLPNLKSSTEDQLLLEMEVDYELSANQQILLQQISDIIINDMIAAIDTDQLLKDVYTAYQHLSYEQADALIQIYQHPDLKNVGAKVPLMIAQIIDLSTDDYNKIMQLTEIQKIIQENNTP